MTQILTVVVCRGCGKASGCSAKNTTKCPYCGKTINLNSKGVKKVTGLGYADARAAIRTYNMKGYFPL